MNLIDPTNNRVTLNCVNITDRFYLSKETRITCLHEIHRKYKDIDRL